MKTKSFNDYLKKRLNKSEIAEIEEQATLEKEGLVSLQEDIWESLSDYMKKEAIGFNELVRRLNITPTQMVRIQKRQANLTLASVAHIYSLMKKTPHIVGKRRSFMGLNKN
jgi:hypothetical protein